MIDRFMWRMMPTEPTLVFIADVLVPIVTIPDPADHLEKHHTCSSHRRAHGRTPEVLTGRAWAVNGILSSTEPDQATRDDRLPTDGATVHDALACSDRLTHLGRGRLS